MEKYKEDKHYSFIEYSGNNITHWSFLDSEDENYSNIDYKKITNKIFLIADRDSEGGEGKKQERFNKLEEKLKNNFCRLTCVEVENYLHEDIVKKVVFDYEKQANKEIKDIDDINFKKNDFTNDDYKNIHLGEFIDGQLVNRKRRASYADSRYNTGTVGDKPEFSRRACNYMRSEIAKIQNNIKSEIEVDRNKYLSKPTQELIVKVIEFIEKNNQ